MRNLKPLSVACICMVFCIVLVGGCSQQLTKQEVMGPGEKYFFVDLSAEGCF